MEKHAELIRFLIVGGVSFLVDNSVYFLLAWAVITDHPTTAKVIAICVATIVSYALNSCWSFSKRRGERRGVEALLFFTFSAIGVGINAAPLYLSRHILELDHEHLSTLWVGVSDFVFGSIIGMIAAMVFRWWSFARFVFPAVDDIPEEQGEHTPVTELVAEAGVYGDGLPVWSPPVIADRSP